MLHFRPCISVIKSLRLAIVWSSTPRYMSIRSQLLERY